LPKWRQLVEFIHGSHPRRKVEGGSAGCEHWVFVGAMAEAQKDKNFWGGLPKGELLKGGTLGVVWGFTLWFVPQKHKKKR